jgi:hypothetical protein
MEAAYATNKRVWRVSMLRCMRIWACRPQVSIWSLVFGLSQQFDTPLKPTAAPSGGVASAASSARLVVQSRRRWSCVSVLPSVSSDSYAHTRAADMHPPTAATTIDSCVQRRAGNL